MSTTQQQLLAAKRANLKTLKSTISPDFGVLTSTSLGFQIDSAAGQAYPAAGAGPIVIATLKMPSNQTGKLAGIAIVHVGASGSFTDGSGDLVWHVFRNGAPLRGFENLYAQVGAIAQPADMALVLLQNDLIQVLVEVPAGKVAPVGNPYARLVGYYNFGGQGSKLPAGNAATPTAVAAQGGSAGYGASGGGTRPPQGGCPELTMKVDLVRSVAHLKPGEFLDCLEVPRERFTFARALAQALGIALQPSTVFQATIRKLTKKESVPCHLVDAGDGFQAVLAWNTPMVAPDGSTGIVANWSGRPVACDRGVGTPVEWRKCVVSPVGLRDVMGIDLGNQVFACGIRGDRRVYSHNLRPKTL